ncbi:uncharacterized protein EI90DRAFT_3157628 [Cantharellus anzutake]|uniref:uncharacterized protein n=1 Tax=Cantharellus anzutake TaxID=1750568 RepID=UPI0019043BF3|nr:uncharacterized protein EI90DRAFT_3157628 [Cantharellus anzutake]KAF8323524.1 hypothetical protein EI90DRAFT_3157628 [Cantharellus anzutake]
MNKESTTGNNNVIASPTHARETGPELPGVLKAKVDWSRKWKRTESQLKDLLHYANVLGPEKIDAIPPPNLAHETPQNTTSSPKPANTQLPSPTPSLSPSKHPEASPPPHEKPDQDWCASSQPASCPTSPTREEQIPDNVSIDAEQWPSRKGHSEAEEHSPRSSPNPRSSLQTRASQSGNKLYSLPSPQQTEHSKTPLSSQPQISRSEAEACRAGTQNPLKGLPRYASSRDGSPTKLTPSSASLQPITPRPQLARSKSQASSISDESPAKSAVSLTLSPLDPSPQRSRGHSQNPSPFTLAQARLTIPTGNDTPLSSSKSSSQFPLLHSNSEPTSPALRRFKTLSFPQPSPKVIVANSDSDPFSQNASGDKATQTNPSVSQDPQIVPDVSPRQRRQHQQKAQEKDDPFSASYPLSSSIKKKIVKPSLDAALGRQQRVIGADHTLAASASTVLGKRSSDPNGIPTVDLSRSAKRIRRQIEKQRKSQGDHGREYLDRPLTWFDCQRIIVKAISSRGHRPALPSGAT